MAGLIALLCAVLIAAALAAIAVARKQSRHTFACPNCGHTFRPKWTRLVFEIHAFDDHMLKCPQCQKTDYCRDLGENP